MRYGPNRKEAVVFVEYDCLGSRKQKRFDCVYKARRFYAAKYKAGKNPKITKAERI